MNFTQETLHVFYTDTLKGFIEMKEKLSTQSETIKKLEDQLSKIVLERAVEQTKNENLLYKLSVMNDKVASAEQRVNELNGIMMKHFAYRNTINQIEPKQTTQQPPTAQQTGFNFPIAKVNNVN
jgi:hypothetical protein